MPKFPLHYALRKVDTCHGLLVDFIDSHGVHDVAKFEHLVNFTSRFLVVNLV